MQGTGGTVMKARDYFTHCQVKHFVVSNVSCLSLLSYLPELHNFLRL